MADFDLRATVNTADARCQPDCQLNVLSVLWLPGSLEFCPVSQKDGLHKATVEMDKSVRMFILGFCLLEPANCQTVIDIRGFASGYLPEDPWTNELGAMSTISTSKHLSTKMFVSVIRKWFPKVRDTWGPHSQGVSRLGRSLADRIFTLQRLLKHPPFRANHYLLQRPSRYI
ncbi:hypothetical protein CLF_100427 [Clonorchis sinensis]|uniref:Uncharacterized protein n=1 Tax=Clonorchis sinensis TaxID=79923 RepID=G7Y3F3_CLOSI|nr:hypothetical protein CLF_100427 [Clonorchis sinensis]